MTKLNIGPGISGTGDVKIDLFPFEGVDHVLDLAVEPIPYPDNHFDEVEASQVLEHIPTQIRWQETTVFMSALTPNTLAHETKWHLRFPRVEIMREIHRVLKPRGVLVASVPHIDRERDVMRWAQDPTHVDVPWILEAFDYFCNGWGGGLCKHEAHYSSGINFGFERIKAEYNDDRSVLTVWLRK
jgi:SAM-dependent methyltransferase